MKKRIFTLSAAILAVVLATGCLKQTQPTPIVLPAGNFVGTFYRYHYNAKTQKVDTLQANLTLILSASTGYSVGGDTTFHAGSHGGYVVDGVNIGFSDATLPATNVTNTPPTKIHLNGVYQYAYTPGSTLQIQQNIADTIVYFYNLRSL